MTAFIIKVLLGLFVWLVLPGLIYKKRRYKKNTLQYFTYIACKIIGILMIILAGVSMVEWLLNYK